MPQLSPPPPLFATPDPSSINPIPSTSKLPSTDTSARPSSGTNSVEESQSPSGGGNETDDEREGSGSGVQTTSREDSDEQVPRQHHHEMYPFPSMAHHQFQRHSSAEVEASSAGSSSSAVSEFSEDDEEDCKMNEVKRIQVPKRSLSEYRASLSRAGLAAPPRIRRIGALGISVHSDSDVENPQVSGLDTNDRIDPASGGNTSSGTRGTDLGVSMAALQAGNGSGSNSEGINVSRKRKRGVADATFRGIVDELAVENRHLKDKLRRYEAHGVPLELKESRLFEIRFYDGLPIEKRTELEGFLTHYVRDFVEKGPSSPPLPPPKKAATDFSTIRPPTPQHSAEHVVQRSLPSPQESVRSERIENKQGRLLADSSNSGVEPFSLSGIGSGVYRPAGFFPSQPFHSLGNPARGPVPAIVTAQDRELAKSVTSSLEQLFRHSLRQNKEEAPDETTKRSRSNETYMANFLSHDFLSDGWVYLNLASTMAELHHYSVTLNFVQQAVRDHSLNLEVSEDGKRIRWTGPSPTSSPPLSQAPSEGGIDTSLDPSQPRAVKIASPAPTDSAASSGRTTVTQSSGNSSNPSSRDPDSNELLANSIAPTASTAPTSLAPSRSTNSKPAAQKSTRPQRPTAAVLQRMDRLSPPATSAQEDPVQGEKSNSRVRQLAAKGEATKFDSAVPQPSISFIAHPDSAMRQAPSIFHRLLRNQAEEDLEFSKEDFIHPGRALPKGPGMLVYYANGHFCSDLTQEEPAEQLTETNRPFVLGAIEASSPPDDLQSLSKAAPIDLDYDDDVGVLNMEVDDEESSAEEGAASSVDSHASSLRRLSASGMTNSTPADLFTILVKMNHPRKHDRKSSSESPSNKRRRYSQAAPHILSSKAFHHRPLMTKRAAPVSFESASSGDEPIVARCHLTTSNLAKHTQPSLQQITPPLDDAPMRPLDSFDRTPSPPHDDYLLSLSAPLHAWAPREYNSITQRPTVPPRPITKSPIALHRRLANPYPTRTFSDMSTTTGDERPISLDDPVASGSRC